MDEISYFKDHARWDTRLRLTPDQFVISTCGRGLIDKRRTIEIALADLDNFALIPIVQIQQVIGGTKAKAHYDYSYDSELFLSYRVDGRRKKKRLFVDGQDEHFCALIEALKERRPDASLLDLDPVEAHRRMGFIQAKHTVWIIVGLLVGLPILATIVILLIQFWSGSPKR